MKRRDFGAAAAAVFASARASSARPPEHQWLMVTAWPEDFPILGEMAGDIAERIARMSDGRLVIRVNGRRTGRDRQGRAIPIFEIFDRVSDGAIEMGHGCPYFWQTESTAIRYFASIPFGLTATELNAWLLYGEGNALWEELYGARNVKPMLAGNTLAQMGGWFKQELNDAADIKKLRIRIPGLAAEVYRRLGAQVHELSPDEIEGALRSDRLNAAEFIGPYSDQNLRLYTSARYYYSPGWHEPGTLVECIVHKPAFEKLSLDLQAIVRAACEAVGQHVMAKLTAKNIEALDSMLREGKVQRRRFSAELLERFAATTASVIAEVAAKDADFARVHDSIANFRRRALPWYGAVDRDFGEARALAFSANPEVRGARRR